MEEQVGGAVEHPAELRRTAAVVDAEWVLDGHVAAEVAAERVSESWKKE